MSNDPAIRISNLSKAYTIAKHDRHQPTNLGEAVMQRMRRPFQRQEKETFWALKDIDLEIERGEVVGVIGRNGAGKSTLLKILSRITEPTTGRIELYGRVGSLLEVGTGFHPELTGRENIYLNGAILGMRRGEIRRQFDAIVDFAGVEQFLDTPVKRYSSGMYVRLAFAVAAHLNPEILIVDEVLAVGDAEFQKKCLGKMQDVAQSGRTVLFVSHNLEAVTTLCSKSILMTSGTLGGFDATPSVLDLYNTYRSNGQSLDNTVRSRVVKNLTNSHITSIRLTNTEGELTTHVDAHFEIALAHPSPQSCYVSLHIHDSSRREIVRIDSSAHPQGRVREDDTLVTIKMRSPHLLPGTYDVDAFLHGGGIIDRWEGAFSLTVRYAAPKEDEVDARRVNGGMVLPSFDFCAST